MILKKIFTLTLLLSVFIPAFSQNQSVTPEQKAIQTVNSIAESVSLLAPNKKDSLVIIFKSYYTDMRQYGASGNDKIISTIKQTRDTEVKSLLSPSQFTEYRSYIAQQDAERQQQRQKAGNNGGGGHHRGGGGNGRSAGMGGGF